jgi:hypothetical protein
LDDGVVDTLGLAARERGMVARSAAVAASAPDTIVQLSRVTASGLMDPEQ